MARPVKFKGMTINYKGPPDTDNVGDLPVMQHRGGITCCWELSDEELEEVQRTGRVYYYHASHTIFPMFIGSESTMRGLTAEMGPLPRQESD